jgi:hypothetical protein
VSRLTDLIEPAKNGVAAWSLLKRGGDTPQRATKTADCRISYLSDPFLPPLAGCSVDFAFMCHPYHCTLSPARPNDRSDHIALSHHRKARQRWEPMRGPASNRPWRPTIIQRARV